jgi:hypothetical protein
MNIFVPILYGERDFDAFGNVDDFVYSVRYGIYKTCQVRGSNPCRGANTQGNEQLADLRKSNVQAVVQNWSISSFVPLPLYRRYSLSRLTSSS